MRCQPRESISRVIPRDDDRGGSDASKFPVSLFPVRGTKRERGRMCEQCYNYASLLAFSRGRGGEEDETEGERRRANLARIVNDDANYRAYSSRADNYAGVIV